MLRGLVIRQLFFAVDLLLMCVIGAAAIFTILRLLDSSSVNLAMNAPTPGEVETIELPQLEDRPAYDAVVAAKLFGEAGQTRKPDEAAPEKDPEELGPSTLALVVKGLSFTTPNDPRSSAIIENPRAKDRNQKIATYFVNQEIMPQVTLHEVHKGYILVKVGGKLERYDIKKRDGSPIRPAVPRRDVAAAPAAPDPPGVKTIDRAEMMQKLLEATESLASMNPRLAYDEDGNALGVTADGLNELPLAQELGFQDGDIVQSINGEVIDSLDKVTEVLQRFSDLDTARINIRRGDKAQMMTFRLQ